jgi:pyruvate ferredoxin oxidoreductase delta subunit
MQCTVGAVVKGGTSLNYKTGTWRDQRPVLDMEKCKSCGQCEMVCPDSSVHVIAEEYVIDYDYCKGCGLCAYECPADAITMVREGK